MTERIDKLLPNPFLSGPADYLCQHVALEIGNVKQFKSIFGDFIDGYKRMDYPIRGLPAVRIYNNIATKDFENWFLEGDLLVDLILPGSLRRNELQFTQDILSSAVMQQFRRQGFFDAIEVLVPALNELGKRFSIDKSLGFEMGEQIVPLTQMTVNFRLDLRKWDDYLESQDRTKDDPFERTLGDLTSLIGVVRGNNDDDVTQVTIGIDQIIGVDS